MGFSNTARKALQTGIELAIPHEMSTPEWAETYRVVDRGSRKGRWSNETVPFLTEIMAAADDPFVREIVFQKSSQVGGSEVINNILGKRIHQSPTEIIYCAESEDKATAWTTESFDTMTRATPELHSLIGKTAEENNQKFKAFPGGGLYLAWATSPKPLSSRPAQILVFDEKAAYAPTKEGDAVKLGQARQKTYKGEELTVFISTPRSCGCLVGQTCGDISHDYERGDQREFYVPCPHCNEFQTLKFGGPECSFGLKWDADAPEAPWYLCESCSALIDEFELDDMLSKGRWIASKPFNSVASFKINQLYSPLMGGSAWATVVADFIEAKTDPAKLEVFTNTTLGETWKPVEMIPWEAINWKLELYDYEVPDGVLMLTAGVDVQADRIECEVVGWGKGHESWSIDYKVFYGSPGIEVSTDDSTEDDEDAEDTEPLTSVWDELATYLQRSFKGRTSLAHRIQVVAVDYGYLSTIVAKFCRKYASRRWYAVKGMGGPMVPIIGRPKKPTRGPKCNVFPVGTNAAKDEVFACLQAVEHGPGYCHFPAREPYTDDAHQKQLCSEKAITDTRNGATTRIYKKVAPGVRNEALDVRVYATAARYIFPPNYDAIASRRLQHTEAADRDPSPDDNTPTPTPPGTPSGPNVVAFRQRRQVKSLNDPFR